MQISARYSCRTTTGIYSHPTFSMPAPAGVAVDFAPTNISAGSMCSAIFTTPQHTLVGTLSEETVTNPSSNEGAIYEAIVLD